MKQLFTFAIMALITQQVLSQSNLSLGIELGGNLSNFKNEFSFQEGDPIFSVSGGLGIFYNIDENAFIKTGVHYAKKGESFDIPGNFNPTTQMSAPSSKLDSFITTLTLPLYGGYQTNGSTRFFVNGGPYFSYIMDADNIIEKKVDIGFGLGLGLKFELPNNNGLRVELRNEFGLANVNGSSIDPNKITTNSLGLFLSYQIQL